MNDTADAIELKRRYDEFAQSLDYKTTAQDFYLRELEIDTACKYIADGMTTLDVGCGLGYGVLQYASRFLITAYGLDYSEKMIEGAYTLRQRHHPELEERTQFTHASVLSMPFDDNYFDIVTSSRCLMALLNWDLQQKALMEIHRVLKPGGILVLMEGTFDGLNKLNDIRVLFNLNPIPADGRDRLFTLKFNEKELLDFCKKFFFLEKTYKFGMYYFLTRIVQPLLVAPEQPTYDHKINEVAMNIAKLFPDFNDIGHISSFILQKRR